MAIMTGVEKIISQIETNSNNRCLEITGSAEKNAEKIIADAKALAAKIQSEATQASASLLSEAKNSAAASALLKKNQVILCEKLLIIDETLTKALEVIKSLPKKEYFDILKELAVKNALSGKGVLRLSKEDADRIPAGFIESINSSIKDKDSSVSLGKNADIDSGFLLIYGDIDINCTFNSIISSKRDELRDALNQLLFCED
ncbi:MAG: V-type ATP synthase subunit E family protein [Oscillospiraceae bacterium]